MKRFLSDVSGVWSCTYGVCFAEAARHHVLHVAVFTQLELGEVDFHLTVFDEHALLHHLRINTHTVRPEQWVDTANQRDAYFSSRAQQLKNASLFITRAHAALSSDSGAEPHYLSVRSPNARLLLSHTPSPALALTAAGSHTTRQTLPQSPEERTGRTSCMLLLVLESSHTELRRAQK